MKQSFRKIDYSLRPAKYAERKMLCDIFRRLRPFARVEDYMYVGFGSLWFSDFILFHRALGVRDMVSIEHSEGAKARIEDNKPFRIPVIYKPSLEALPDLEWARHQFIWLDYDDCLAAKMLADMRIVAERANPGTAITVSVQCSKAPELAQAEQDEAPGAPAAIERFTAIFGRNRIPDGTAEDELSGWAYGALSRGVLLREIEEQLAVRNADGQLDLRFKLICEIEYDDNAKMTTFVGVFYSGQAEEALRNCHFETLDFLNEGGKPIRIEVPKLTTREFRRLESQLPLSPASQLQLGTIPPGEVKNFPNMYRYLPNFGVLET